jgi:hypothetical protein
MRSPGELPRARSLSAGAPSGPRSASCRYHAIFVVTAWRWPSAVLLTTPRRLARPIPRGPMVLTVEFESPSFDQNSNDQIRVAGIRDDGGRSEHCTISYERPYAIDEAGGDT